MSQVVVTRHAGLVTFLREEGLIGTDAIVLPHVTREQIAGRHVIGVLPLHLAECAASVTEIPLDLPVELRGVELTAAQARQYAKAPRRYRVVRLDP